MYQKGELKMCKTYEAIQEISKTAESDVVILWVGHKKVSGKLYNCEDGKCYENIVTLQDAIVESCKEDGECSFFEFKWLNIPARAIKAFTFKCCVK